MKQMKIVVAFACAVMFATIVSAQAPKKQSPSALATGVDAGQHSMPVLADTDHPAIFSLKTSWISGEEHKGYLRYQLEAYGKGVSEEDASAYIKQLAACRYTLALLDTNQFILRHYTLFFTERVNESGHLVLMRSNDMGQMDLTEYQRFLASGDWEITWSCF
jgi:hypothetical protein